MGALLLLPLSVRGGELDEAEKALAKADVDIKSLRSRYLGTDTGRSVEVLQKQAQQGEVYYLLKDYLRASIILWDIVEDPKNQSLPNYKDAVYYLADSLYYNDNWLAARFYFEQILADATSPHRENALLRLLQMATVSGDGSTLDNLLVEALGMSGAPAELNYTIGKALFARKRYEEAFSYFSKVPSSDAQYLPSQYLLGVIRVAQARAIIEEARKSEPDALPDEAVTLLEEGKGFFQKVLTLTPLPSQEEFISLSHLSLGRIYYELGRLDDAAKEYLDIPPGDENYADSRYELAWVYISQNDLTRAYTTLESMRLRVKEGPIVSEVMILEGSILSELGRYPEALATYEELRQTFSPIQKQMEGILAEITDPRAHFLGVLEKRQPTDAREFLPASARPWVSGAPLVVRGLKIRDDLRLIEANLKECDEIVALLEGKLTGKSRIEAFPTLVEGRTKGLELLDLLGDVRDAAVSTMAKDLLPSASPAERQKLEALSVELARVEGLFKTIPRSKEAYKERESAVEDRFSELTKRAHKLSLSVDGLSARLVALQKYYEDTKAERSLSPEEDKELQEQIEKKREEIAALSELLDSLKAEIERERALVGTNDDAFVREDEIRAYYKKILREEEEILSQIASRVAGTSNLSRARALLEKVQEGENEIESFFLALNEEVEARLVSLRTEVATEKLKLVQYREELTALRAEGLSVASDVIYASFLSAHRHFSELVLRSNVGIIDVAWAMKEKAGQEYIKVKEKKQADLDALHELFDEALKEQ